MSSILPIAQALRFVLELCALAALGYWGWQTGRTPGAQIALGIGVPLAAAALWGLFVAPKARIAAPAGVRFAIELAVFALAAIGLLLSGQPKLALALAIAYLIHHALLYLAQR